MVTLIKSQAEATQNAQMREGEKEEEIFTAADDTLASSLLCVYFSHTGFVCESSEHMHVHKFRLEMNDNVKESIY